MHITTTTTTTTLTTTTTHTTTATTTTTTTTTTITTTTTTTTTLNSIGVDTYIEIYYQASPAGVDNERPLDAAWGLLVAVVDGVAIAGLTERRSFPSFLGKRVVVGFHHHRLHQQPIITTTHMVKDH